jgi:hypothetical protein
LYLCMKLGHWDLQKSFYVRGRGMRENDGGDEPNQDNVTCNMEMSQWNLCNIYDNKNVKENFQF